MYESFHCFHCKARVLILLYTKLKKGTNHKSASNLKNAMADILKTVIL